MEITGLALKEAANQATSKDRDGKSSFNLLLWLEIKNSVIIFGILLNIITCTSWY